MADLNAAQRAAVEYIDGASLVIAGAGSGKTRVLTYKIAWLLEYGYRPWELLALTFTNKAAAEMKSRVAALVGEREAHDVTMGTFHSVFARILRREAEATGYDPRFTIYDEADSRSLLKAIVKSMQLDEKVYRAATVHSRISGAKNRAWLPKDYAADSYSRERDKHSGMEALPRIYAQYQQRLRQANAMDFDDLLLLTFSLFREHDDIRRKWAGRFRFVLVDEYQDTNHVQAMIVEQLAREHKRVTAVGDDSQSIYAFRGADIGNILSFQRTFGTPEAPVRLFKLERNYRSTKNIVGAANSLIAHNERRIPKDVYSEQGEGESVAFRQLYTDREEAAFVSRDIRRRQLSQDIPYSAFAILYRTNAQSRSFEQQLRRDALPYRIYGGLSFYQRKEIKDAIAYLRLAVNPSDEEALRRVINYPARGIGSTTIDRIMTRAMELGRAPWDVVRDPEGCALDVNKGAQGKLRTFAALIESFAARATTTDAATLSKAIMGEAGITKDIFSGTEPEDVARQENLEELIGSLQEFVDTATEEGQAERVFVSDFLEEVSLMSDLDSPDDGEERITLMTIHSAKGLEYPVVYVVGMEEGLLPSANATTQKAVEEERRLLYVAITRAGTACTLTAAESRYRYGREERMTPSRFIREIDERFMPSTTGSAGIPAREAPQSHPARVTHDGRRMSRLPADNPAGRAADGQHPEADGLTVGLRVEHERFGRGIIASLEGTGESRKARIDFEEAGEKMILLKYARLRPVGLTS